MLYRLFFQHPLCDRQGKTPHWDRAWEGSQLRGSLWCLEAPQMRWAVWQLSHAGTVHWELLKHWRLRSPTCRNALCPISAGVCSWKSLLSPLSSSTSAAHWKRFRCLKIPGQKMPVASEFLVPLVQSQIPFPAAVGTWILGSCHLTGWCVFLASYSKGSAVLTWWSPAAHREGLLPCGWG